MRHDGGGDTANPNLCVEEGGIQHRPHRFRTDLILFSADIIQFRTDLMRGGRHILGAPWRAHGLQFAPTALSKGVPPRRTCQNHCQTSRRPCPTCQVLPALPRGEGRGAVRCYALKPGPILGSTERQEGPPDHLLLKCKKFSTFRAELLHELFPELKPLTLVLFTGSGWMNDKPPTPQMRDVRKHTFPRTFPHLPSRLAPWIR